jgi:alkylhydroperoxidase family enzyme
MPARTARALQTNPQSAPLEPDLRALVNLAVEVTERPATVTPQEIARIVETAHSRAEYLDAVGVITGFNFITRVASALGVKPEMSPWLRRFDLTRRFALGLSARTLRWFVDLCPRHYPIPSAEQSLSGLERIFDEAGLGPLPQFFRELETAPHLLEVQQAMLAASVRASGSDLSMFMKTGLIALDEVKAPVLGERVAAWIRRQKLGPIEDILERSCSTVPDGPARREIATLKFARDVSRQSYRITYERIDELRSCGLKDEDILDLVFNVSLWNACGRMEILLTGIPLQQNVLSRPENVLSRPGSQHRVGNSVSAS